jgi:hypothetical protein
MHDHQFSVFVRLRFDSETIAWSIQGYMMPPLLLGRESVLRSHACSFHKKGAKT